MWHDVCEECSISHLGCYWHGSLWAAMFWFTIKYHSLSWTVVMSIRIYCDATKCDILGMLSTNAGVWPQIYIQFLNQKIKNSGLYNMPSWGIALSPDRSCIQSQCTLFSRDMIWQNGKYLVAMSYWLAWIHVRAHICVVRTQAYFLST